MSAPPLGCNIKGYINSEGEKIYHKPCGTSYADTVIIETDGERRLSDEISNFYHPGSERIQHENYKVDLGASEIETMSMNHTNQT